MTKPGDLLTLAMTFSVLSFFAIGGALATVPEMHRIAVDTYHWMTDQQFTDTFAIAQLSPGPNVLIVTLIGYHVAGVLGAFVATLAMCGPAAIIAWFVGGTFQRSQDAAWAIIIQTALVPISVGLIVATSFILGMAATTSWMAGLITLGGAVLMFTTRISPLWILIAGGVAGAVGLL